MNQRKRRRSAMTLVELVVVIGIVGILIAMLLPAVHSIRESARLTDCKSRIRQLAIAALDYEQSHQAFPPGQLTLWHVSDFAEIDFSNQQLVGHLGYLLPWLDEGNFRSEFSEISWAIEEFGPPWYSLLNLVEVSNRVIRPLRCPSDSDEPISHLGISTFLYGAVPGNALSAPSIEELGIPPGYHGWTSYLGSTGVIDGDSNPLQTGIFFSRSTISAADVSDGQSNTILFGEVAGSGASSSASGLPTDFKNMKHSIMQNGISSPRFFFDDTDDNLDESVFIYSSRHRGGHYVNFAFVDGHTQTYPSSTDRLLLRNLTTRNGGEIVELD